MPPGTRNSLKNIRDKLSADGKLIVCAITEEIQALHVQLTDEFNCELQKVRDEFTAALSSKNEETESFKQELLAAKGEINTLTNNVLKMKASIDEADAYQRRETVILSGTELPAAQPNENCANIVRTIIRDKLRLSIDPAISTAHRLGKPPNTTNTPDKRNIIVKFCQRDVKHTVYSAARQMKLRGLYVNESLTPTRSTILYALRQIKRAHPQLVTGCSTYDGKVFAYTKPSPNAPPEARNIRIEINTNERLAAFCTDFIRQPLETFLNAFPQ